MLFVAAQLVDIFFFLFLLFGIEKFSIVANITQVNHFNLNFMPYTHSLVATIGWAIFGGIFLSYFWKSKTEKNMNLKIKETFPLIALVIISHFLLDIPMHNPDLPIFDNNSTKIGFGLWSYLWISIAFELILIIIGLFLYKKLFPNNLKEGQGFWSKYGFIFISFVIISPFLPVPMKWSYSH